AVVAIERPEGLAFLFGEVHFPRDYRVAVAPQVVPQLLYRIAGILCRREAGSGQTHPETQRQRQIPFQRFVFHNPLFSQVEASPRYEAVVTVTGCDRLKSRSVPPGTTTAWPFLTPEATAPIAAPLAAPSPPSAIAPMAAPAAAPLAVLRIDLAPA